jgi:hypothetical protein
VDPVTPAEGEIGVVMTGGTICEAVTSLIVFFGGSDAEGFLQIGAPSEYKLNLQTIKYKSRSLHTWARASSSSTVSEIFWPAGCQP